MVTAQFESRFIQLIKYNQILNNIITIVVGSCLIAVAAQISIPLQPVPITLQTFAVMLVGMTLGPIMGGKIVLAYLIAGSCGLPVFANFSFGIPTLFGPTGGYLFGFLPAVILTGYLLQNGWIKYRTTTFIAGLLGTIILFISGYLVLAQMIGWDSAYKFGVVPFYIAEIGKLTILAILAPLCWHKKS